VTISHSTMPSHVECLVRKNVHQTTGLHLLVQKTLVAGVIVHSSNIPKLKMSAFSVHFSFVSTSGAAHAKVPAGRELRHGVEAVSSSTCVAGEATVLPSRMQLHA
jgi:hypothetical protein